MSLSKKVVLTVSGYKISLSDSLQFYQNDQLKLIFEINKYGIDVASSFTHKTLMPLQPLTATLFIETPLGVDSIESANIEDNAVTFYLTSNQTQHIGISSMQIKLTDDDGCQITLPSFTFEVQKNIYDNAVHVSGILLADENGNVLSDENGNTINTTTTTESSKQIKDFSLKTGISGQEDILVQDNGVTKRIKSSELMDSVDLSGYATKAELNNKAEVTHIHSYNDLTNKPTIPSLTGYATETFVTDKIAEASLSGGEVDLSGYATKSDLNSKANVSHTHTKSDITDLSIPTKTSQLTNDSGFISSIPSEYITETELTSKRYATENFVTETVNNASVSGGYTHPTTHPASMIVFTDGENFQTKLDSGTLKGDKGDTGEQGPKGEKGDTGPAGQNGSDGLTTQVKVNSVIYTHSNGLITLPDYPSTLPANGGNADTIDNIHIRVLTQSEYDSLASKDSNTIYIIKEV